VLVVEDHDDSRDIWERVLGYCSALVTAARSALKAASFRQVLQKPVDPWQLAEAILAAVH
jgi:hypothetical protein